jgi:patatin-related protein
MDLPKPAETPRKDETRELRLALVCYGGVSLAIWMHGVTKELQKLVEASEAYDDPARGRPTGGTEAVYYDMLEAHENESKWGIRTRVVIDIVAGTSAGGINGIVLAKALARGLDQEPVTRVWLDDGDLKQLMRSKPLRAVPSPIGKAGAWLGASLLRGFSPPLRGDLLLKLVHEALGKMDEPREKAQPVSPNNPVELHVTMTDFTGYDHGVPADWPRSITDRRYRHVLSFFAANHDLEPARNYRLAFAARATSSFPGAFAPVDFRDMAEVLGVSAPDLDAFESDQWSIYKLSGADVRKTRLVDGGVLDNAPFALAIKAIQAKPAASEVKRRLVFIQPDPPLPGGGADGDDVGLFATVWGSTGRLPRHEPMLDDLLELRDFNDRVDRVAAIMEAGTAQAKGISTADARDEAGFAYASYAELKLYGVVERLAAFAAGMCRFPPDSGQAAFVRAVLLRWARDAELIATGAPVSDEQTTFLATFDLDYGERRLRHVIRRLNDCYRAQPAPARGDVNALKAQLYAFIEALWAPVGKLDPAPVRELFDAGKIAAALTGDGTWNDTIEQFAQSRRAPLDSVRDAIGAHLEAELKGFGDSVRSAIVTAVEEWPEESAAGVLEAYDRFPYWDVLLYPLRRASETAELDHVEVRRLSPYEVSLLSTAGPKKLEGVKSGHFGAFFSRKARENDYLWGRLDAAEWIVRLLFGEADRQRCADAFDAVLASEQDLREVAKLRGELAEQVTELRSASGIPG